ncbi:hypothetical protein H6F89_07240 [Cyanobacteria bacterium FACHB-63]|nr:hypothetical protein [Cyanobacteria bacterium FACHB-63]
MAQQHCLEHLAPRLNGRTRKQQNPYPAATLSWATWYIARLGDCRAMPPNIPQELLHSPTECGSLIPSFSDGNWLRLHLCVHGSPRQ